MVCSFLPSLYCTCGSDMQPGGQVVPTRLLGPEPRIHQTGGNTLDMNDTHSYDLVSVSAQKAQQRKTEGKLLSLRSQS